MTSRTLLALAALLALPSLTAASGADAVARKSDASRSRSASPGMSVSATDAQGMTHGLDIEAKDGRVIVHGEPDLDRPWLGVLLSDEDEVQKLGGTLPTREGRWTISGVADDSPAKRAGLRRGDVITGAGGRDVTTEGPGLLQDTEPGDVITLDIERDGKPMKVQVKVGSHPGTVEFEDADGLGALDLAGNMLSSVRGLEALKSLKGLKSLPCPQGTAPKDCPGLTLPFVGGPRLGVNVEPMSEQLARYFGAQPGHGILVMDVVAGSPAEKGGVQAGDVILRVADRDVRAVSDIRLALTGHEAGDVVTVDVLRKGQPVSLSVTLEETQRHGWLTFPDGAASARQAAELAAEALAQARASMSDEDLAQLHEKLKQVEAEVEKTMSCPAVADALRRAEVTAKQRAEEGLRAKERARAKLRASGAFDPAARAELERALEGGTQVTGEGLIDF